MLNHEPSMSDVMAAVKNFEKYIVGIVNKEGLEVKEPKLEVVEK